MAEERDEHGYPVIPRHIEGADAWFYEQKEGVCLVVGGKTVTIPWRQVRSAMERHNKRRTWLKNNRAS